MATLLFLIISSVGFFSTVMMLKAIRQSEKSIRQGKALTFALGFGLTWFFSFLVPVAYSKGFEVEIELFLFIFFTSVMVWLLCYVIGLYLFRHKDKNRIMEKNKSKSDMNNRGQND